jgi:hypothetical protein
MARHRLGSKLLVEIAHAGTPLTEAARWRPSASGFFPADRRFARSRERAGRRGPLAAGVPRDSYDRNAAGH